MAGEWSAAKVKAFKEAFFQFLDHVYINSKDLGGNTCLGRHVYRAQKLLFKRICEGLRKGKHNFFVLKSRQLGVSTFSRALSVFWLGMHDGLEGAIVFDTDSNRNKARREIEAMIRGLPAGLKFPKIVLSNRDGLTLANGSTIQFLSAGVGGTRSSGGLGRSSGLSYGHMSEMCSWTNAEGVESLKNAFSDLNPDRFYIWESTARGWGLWSDMWEEARLDENHSECIFLGWWSKDSQKIDRDDPDFEIYGSTPPTDRELERIKDVFERYGHQITPEQLAWIRRKMDPSAKGEGDADPDYEGNEIRLQEQPWVEEDAFQMTAATFFEPTKLTEMVREHVSNKYKTYAYTTGIEFIDCRVYPASNAKSVQLKVWEEPEDDGVYVIAADPAFGHSELSDRSAIQVLRCYADGVDQVAEYAWPLVNTRQFAWVIASLLGWYGECYLILELNGPGEAVWQELQSLKRQLANGYQMREVEERGLRNMFQNVKNYLYGRADSMTPGRSYMWKALDLKTPLPTPTGWTTMGAVAVGDNLLDESGRPCRVTLKTEVMIGRPCYAVIFDDGTQIIADEDHLWRVRGNRGRTDFGPEIVRTIDLIPGQHTIEMTDPLEMPPADLPIDPYVLGVWLGDGYSDGGRFSAHHLDIADISQNLASAGAELGRISREKGRDTCYRNIVGLCSKLAKSRLLGNKHIPAEYLRGSVEQRLALLQGLMDTDGSIGKTAGRVCTFSTSSLVLAAGFSELLRSLGLKARFVTRERELSYAGNTVTCKTSFQFAFTAYPELPVFRMKRKLDRINRTGDRRPRRAKRHQIVSVTPTQSVPVKCIQVDSPSHLYLAGPSMVPTHNTTGQLKVGLMERLRDFTENMMLRVRSFDTLEEMKWITREGDKIGGDGSKKDDRVMALALAVRCWEERARRIMAPQKRTRAAEIARRRLTIRDQVKLFNEHQLTTFFAVKAGTRRREANAARRQAWRGR